MLLSWNGEEVALSDLTEQVYSPSLKGSLQPSIIAAARRNGYLAFPIKGQKALLAELEKGHPVLVLQNLGFSWFPRWHYAVAIGYDRKLGTVFLHSGKQAELKMSAYVFARTWARSNNWGLVILAPGILPATAYELSYLTAASGLERANQGEAASLAYRAAIQRWPTSYIAWMGFGNSLYSINDLEGAVGAFRQAALLQPNSGVALNNLATALAAAGKKKEALDAIAKAIDMGGELRERFLQTQHEIHVKE